MAAKIPKVFGRQILEGQLVIRRGHKQQEFAINFAVGHGEFEVYSQDWKKCYHSFQIADGRADMIEDNLLRIEYAVKGQAFDFLIRFDRCDLILNAFSQAQPDRRGAGENQITNVPTKEIYAFGCNLPPATAESSFVPYLEAQARKRLLFLSSSVETNEPLLAAIACEFRMRFPQIEPDNWTEAFEVLWFEFVAFCVSLWTQCLKSVIEPHTGPNSFEYFRRLAASISALLAKGADVFNVDRRAFLIAVRKFLDEGDPGDIPATSKALVSDVELALGNVRKRWLLQLTDMFEFTQLFSVSVVIASAVSPLTKDICVLAGQLCSWSISMVNSLTRGPRIQDFRNGIEKLSVSVLRANDTKRYSPEFHCTLALWKLAELARAVE
ncbi:hypothetical protein TVAG_047090 [Trichomonas vaginalis G3]|uniref:Uncharacterized protein n=1 Tax=Trichomonas vaginalis (strain ATCC PRA-98 / G3) TaxID=412133 RepID=A2EAT4_TRIV3|nr:hypothetical protein TVAGG3_0959070 [Trichomonas vaginalis G3]EAY10287.1 hypothetical protein TVAG_047090 [Trichomonas vaginalis G3]KAI5487769.1 hypothetical protein TVAGG3_0959070 [Trichomonas vaginalis G3]|eukprot:XP_001322510.1 hypothetical protein [Trichomonas vaginalis G3]